MENNIDIPNEIIVDNPENENILDYYFIETGIYHQYTVNNTDFTNVVVNPRNDFDPIKGGVKVVSNIDDYAIFLLNIECLNDVLYFPGAFTPIKPIVSFDKSPINLKFYNMGQKSSITPLPPIVDPSNPSDYIMATTTISTKPSDNDPSIILPMFIKRFDNIVPKEINDPISLSFSLYEPNHPATLPNNNMEFFINFKWVIVRRDQIKEFKKLLKTWGYNNN